MMVGHRLCSEIFALRINPAKIIEVRAAARLDTGDLEETRERIEAIRTQFEKLDNYLRKFTNLSIVPP